MRRGPVSRLVTTALLCGAATMGLCAWSAARYVAQPPERFRGDNAAAVRFVREAQPACLTAGMSPPAAGRYIAGCTVARTIIVPNPCRWPNRSDYADLMCHELAHVNGWPAAHPGAEP